MRKQNLPPCPKYRWTFWKSLQQIEAVMAKCNKLPHHIFIQNICSKYSSKYSFKYSMNILEAIPSFWLQKRWWGSGTSWRSWRCWGRTRRGGEKSWWVKKWKYKKVEKVENLNEKVREANSHFNRASVYKKKIEEEGNRVRSFQIFYDIDPRQIFLTFLGFSRSHFSRRLFYDSDPRQLF